MKFQVKALRDSFNVVSVVLDAADEADAERQAKSSGLAVLSLKRAASGTILDYSGTDHVLFRPGRRGSFDNPERRVLAAPATPATPSDVSSPWKAGFAPLLI